MAYTVTTGELNQRVTLQRKTLGQQPNGEPVTTWASIAKGTVWAKVQQLTGREQITAQQVQYPAEVRIVIRYRADLDAEQHRVLWQGRPYEIVGQPARVGTGGEWLEIMATHGVRDGR